MGVTGTEADWTTAWLTASDGLYLWTVFFVTYADGTAEWTTPTCLSDSAARDSISTLATELEVVQGQITAKVWQSDIDEAADALNESITTLQDRYSAIMQTVDGITSEIADLTTVVGDNYTALQTKITTVEQTAEGLISRVTEAESSISDNAFDITTLSSEYKQLADSIALCVTTDADTGYLRLGAGSDGMVKFTVDSANLTIDEDGNATFSGVLVAASGSFSGTITATGGTIGGWNITSSRIRSSSTISIGKEESGMLLINEDDKPYIHVQDDTGHTTFQVSRTGTVYIDNGFRMYNPTEDAWVKAMYFTGEDDAVLKIEYDLSVYGLYTTEAVNCNALICEVGAAFTGEVTMYGDISVNGYAVPRKTECCPNCPA